MIMDFLEKLDDKVLEKINEIKEEIKREQKEIYSLLLEITKSFSDNEKDKKYRDSLFERVDLLNIIIKENNKKINDLKNGEYKENFNSVISDVKIDDTISEVEEITNELKELEELKNEESTENIEEINLNLNNDIDDFIEETIEISEEIVEEDVKSEEQNNPNESKKIDLKKELEDIVKQVNGTINSEEVVEKVPVLFSTSSYTNSNSRRANTQLIVREEKNSFSDRIKGVLNRIKKLIIK